MGFFLLFSLAVCSSPFSFMIFVKGGSFWWSATKPKQNRKRNQNSEDCLGPRPDHDLFLPFLFLSSSFSVPFLFLQYSFFMSTMFLCPLFPFLSPFHFFRSSFFPLLFLFLFSSFLFLTFPLLFVFHVSLSSLSFMFLSYSSSMFRYPLFPFPVLAQERKVHKLLEPVWVHPVVKVQFV